MCVLRQTSTNLIRKSSAVLKPAKIPMRSGNWRLIWQQLSSMCSLVGRLAVLLLLLQSLHCMSCRVYIRVCVCVRARTCMRVSMSKSEVQDAAPVSAVHTGPDAAADAILLWGTDMCVALHHSICPRQHCNLRSRIAPCIPYVTGTLLVFMRKLWLYKRDTIDFLTSQRPQFKVATGPAK